jgi:hypothetical protein
MSPGEINLADIAESLDYREQQEVASMIDGWELYIDVNPSYAFRASGKKEDLYHAVELTSDEREHAENILDNNEDVSNTEMPLNWIIKAEDIMDVFERYENTQDPFHVSKPERELLTKIKGQGKIKRDQDETPSWAEKVHTKEFPGLGEFKQIASGAYKTVYAGPVNGDDLETVVYAPTELRRPGIFEDMFSKSMVHSLAIDQNTEKLNDDGRIPASETVEPVVLDLRGQPYTVAVGEYADMEDVPDEYTDEARSLAKELESDITDEKLYYHSTFDMNTSQEFAKGDFRRDNIKYDEERGIVVADPGEAGEAELEEVREVLGENNIQKLENFREKLV